MGCVSRPQACLQSAMLPGGSLGCSAVDQRHKITVLQSQWLYAKLLQAAVAASPEFALSPSPLLSDPSAGSQLHVVCVTVWHAQLSLVMCVALTQHHDIEIRSTTWWSLALKKACVSESPSMADTTDSIHTETRAQLRVISPQLQDNKTLCLSV